jgi:hypothetical protein
MRTGRVRLSKRAYTLCLANLRSGYDVNTPMIEIDGSIDGGTDVVSRIADKITGELGARGADCGIRPPEFIFNYAASDVSSQYSTHLSALQIGLLVLLYLIVQFFLFYPCCRRSARSRPPPSESPASRPLVGGPMPSPSKCSESKDKLSRVLESKVSEEPISESPSAGPPAVERPPSVQSSEPCSTGPPHGEDGPLPISGSKLSKRQKKKYAWPC